MTNETAARLLNNRKPQLNHYQLACGYAQLRIDTRQHLSLQLWHESSHYHVRVAYHDHPDMVGWIDWEVFDTLKDARNMFAALARQRAIRSTRA